MNQALPSLHEELLEIKLTVPLKKNIYLFLMISTKKLVNLNSRFAIKGSCRFLATEVIEGIVRIENFSSLNNQVLDKKILSGVTNSLKVNFKCSFH